MDFAWPIFTPVITAPNNSLRVVERLYCNAPSLAVSGSLVHITYSDAARVLYDVTYDDLGRRVGIPVELPNERSRTLGQTNGAVRTAAHSNSLYAFYCGIPDRTATRVSSATLEPAIS